jgi:hypothetical protein
MLLLGLFLGFGTDFVLEAVEHPGYAHSQPQA